MEIENIEKVETIINDIRDVETFLKNLPPVNEYKFYVSTDRDGAELEPRFKSKENAEFVKHLKGVIRDETKKHIQKLKDSLKEL